MPVACEKPPLARGLSCCPEAAAWFCLVDLRLGILEDSGLPGPYPGLKLLPSEFDFRVLSEKDIKEARAGAVRG